MRVTDSDGENQFINRAYSQFCGSTLDEGMNRIGPCCFIPTTRWNT